MSQDVKVRIAADSTALQTGLTAASASVSAFAAKTTVASATVGKMQAAMVAAGAMGAKAMAGLQAALGPLLIGLGALMGLKSLGDAAGQINDLSQRFGESAETMQRVKYAADQSGTSIETVAKSMNKAELAAVAAAGGNEEMNQAFQALGLSAEEFAGLPMEEKLAAIAEGYDSNANKAEALAAMVKIMGKSAGELIPLFAQGGEAVTEMMNSAATASSNSIARIDEVQDRFGGMFDILKVWAFESIGFVLDLIDKMSVGIAAAIAFVSNLSGGIDEAKDAYNDTLEAGLDYLEDQKKGREERKNKISSANIEEIKAEAVEEKTAKEDVRKEKTEDAKFDDYFQTIEDAKKDAANRAVDIEEKAAKELEKKKKKSKISDAENLLDSSEDKLDGLKGSLSKREGNKPAFDQLRRIGGNLANSNFKDISKENVALQKQIDLQQKAVEELKNVVKALKQTPTTDGITS